MDKKYYMYDSCACLIWDETNDEYLTNFDACNLLNDQNETIINLEAKLAESEENNKLLEIQLQDMERSKLAWENKYFKLEKQLAEKEKEIEEMKEGQKDICLRCGGLTHKQYEQSQNQTAIEKLEKVKDNILKIDKTEIKTLENGYSTLYVDRPEIITIIDQQIKSLKGEK